MLQPSFPGAAASGNHCSGFCRDFVPYAEGNNSFERQCGNTKSRLVQCRDCGYCRFDPIPTDAELNHHYQTAYPEASAEHYDLDREYSRPDLPLVATHLIETVRKFGCRVPKLDSHDYGCAMGNLVYALKQAGVNATGHDINRNWISLASTKLGAAVTAEPFEQAFAGSDRKLHLVTMLHVLEHMPDPVAAVRAVHARLADTGIVYICVPNALFLGAEVFGKEKDEFNFMYPTHLHYYSPNSMKGLLESANLRLLHLVTRPSHLSPGGRTLLLDAARQIGLGTDEPAIMTRLSREFRTAELFAVACREDSPTPRNFALADRIAAQAPIEQPLWRRLERAVQAIDGSRRIIVCSNEPFGSTFDFSHLLTQSIEFGRMMFEPIGRRPQPKAFSHLIAKAAAQDAFLIYLDDGSVDVPRALKDSSDASVLPLVPLTGPRAVLKHPGLLSTLKNWTARLYNRKAA
jgi:2-polyprenyl-3-methyl-5-hydroxy-6-metoxy-1,4-benzoquinol methylase